MILTILDGTLSAEFIDGKIVVKCEGTSDVFSPELLTEMVIWALGKHLGAEVPPIN